MTGLTAVAAQAPSAQLAEWSNLALYSAMAVYTIAMLLFASYLAALGPASPRNPPRGLGDADATVEAPAKELVGQRGGDPTGGRPAW